MKKIKLSAGDKAAVRRTVRKGHPDHKGDDSGLKMAVFLGVLFMIVATFLFVMGAI